MVIYKLNYNNIEKRLEGTNLQPTGPVDATITAAGVICYHDRQR
jgi:hypothetical protein